MIIIEVNYVKIDKGMPDIKINTANSAGVYLFACIEEENVILQPGEFKMIKSGIQMELPEGTVGLIFPRSGTGVKGLVIKNGTGVIDSDYRG